MSQLTAGYASGRILSLYTQYAEFNGREFLKLGGQVEVTAVKDEASKKYVPLEQPEQCYVDAYLSGIVTNWDEATWTGWVRRNTDPNDPQVMAWYRWAVAQEGGIFYKAAYDVCDAVGLDLDATPDWCDRIYKMKYPPKTNFYIKYVEARAGKDGKQYDARFICTSISKPLIGRKPETPDQTAQRLALTKKLMSTMKVAPKLDNVGVIVQHKSPYEPKPHQQRQGPNDLEIPNDIPF